MCHVVLLPPGRLDWHMTGRRRASALSWRCFTADHRELQRSRPTDDHAAPLSLPHAPQVHAPRPQIRIVSSSIWPRKTYRSGRTGDLGAGIVHNCLIQKPCVHGFPNSCRSIGSHCRPFEPPTVPSMARLRGFQRPSRGDEEMPIGLREHPPLGPPPLPRRPATASAVGVAALFSSRGTIRTAPYLEQRVQCQNVASRLCPVVLQHHGFEYIPSHSPKSKDGHVYISLRRATNGHMCTLDSGGVMALHL
jgi:hypothetical protein